MLQPTPSPSKEGNSIEEPSKEGNSVEEPSKEGNYIEKPPRWGFGGQNNKGGWDGQIKRKAR